MISLANPVWNPAAAELVNIIDADGCSIIHHTVKYNRPEFIAPLIHLGAKMTSDRTGRTPLHHAAWYRFEEMMVALIPYSDIDTPDDNGWTPLFTIAATVRRSPCLELLLAVGADPTILPTDGFLDVQLETIQTRLTIRAKHLSEQKIREIREHVYFRSTLLSQLLIV